MIKGIILDFDGTLCLTHKTTFKLQNEALAKMGRKEMDLAVFLRTWGGDLSKTMQVRSPGVNFEEFKKIYDETIKEYASKGELDKVPKKNLETLEKLLRQGRYVAILTTRSQNEIKHLLDEKHPLSVLIKDIYHKDNLNYLKPNPKVFDKVLKDNNLSAKDCVYVGDSLSDAEAAIGAGMNFIASLESELKTHSDFEIHNVKYFINKFPDLFKVLEILDPRS